MICLGDHFDRCCEVHNVIKHLIRITPGQRQGQRQGQRIPSLVSAEELKVPCYTNSRKTEKPMSSVQTFDRQ